jgi:hypothetical protein
MPIQVVKPSVSFAAVLQGTALTISVEIPSFPTLDSPVVEFGSRGLPGAGTAPVGAGTAGGGGGKALGTCCAKHADPANVSVIAKRKNDRFMASLPSYNASLRQRLILFNWTDDFGSTIIPDLMQTVKPYSAQTHSGRITIRAQTLPFIMCDQDRVWSVCQQLLDGSLARSSNLLIGQRRLLRSIEQRSKEFPL